MIGGARSSKTREMGDSRARWDARPRILYLCSSSEQDRTEQVQEEAEAKVDAACAQKEGQWPAWTPRIFLVADAERAGSDCVACGSSKASAEGTCPDPDEEAGNLHCCGVGDHAHDPNRVDRSRAAVEDDARDPKSHRHPSVVPFHAHSRTSAANAEEVH